MGLIFAIAVSLCALIYFGGIRMLNDKWREIFHFLIAYILMFVVFNIAWHIFQKCVIDPQYWHLSFLFCPRLLLPVFSIHPG
jgi:hypothetical protein